MAVNGDDLAAMVEEELDQAQALSWEELRRITPWGDSYTGLTPAGEEVEAVPAGEFLAEPVEQGFANA